MTTDLAEKFVEDKSFREQYIEKTDVLDKVKLLNLLPDNKFAEAREVASYFEVDIDTIRQIRNRHKEELDVDGIIMLNGENFKKYRQEIALHGVTLLAKSNITLYPRRSILRIGMLLRDSEVAKQVRTYLLNVEQESSKEQRQAVTKHTGTWTAKEELILLDTYYTTVLNGGSLNAAAKKASEKISHTVAACLLRYSNRLKELVTDEKFHEIVENNKFGKKNHLTLVPDIKVEQADVANTSSEDFTSELKNLNDCATRLYESNIRLLEEKNLNLEEEVNTLKTRVKRLIKEKNEITNELNINKSVIASAIKLNVNKEIKSTFTMDRNGNLERSNEFNDQ